MVHAFARAISILGHPMLVLPVAALLLATRTLGAREAAWMALGFAGFAALVMGWSGWQVRRGRWQHVDASRHEERRTLNRFLLVALTLAAVLGWVAGQPLQLALGLILAAALIAVAMLGARWCKLSLHMAFVIYAAILLSQLHPAWGIVGLAFAALVAWSRLKLRRHVPRDLVAGALAGATAGGLFVWLAPKLAGA
ncbi:phosphatase PAP2 family protein [Pseudoxanthomonas sp. 22568]|uniref:phosphatase PAP2 family protein n=1 Tax=Pseudoxanthomonas sp. 22568 TaxID=3453945 RepID=UPI003F82CAB0